MLKTIITTAIVGAIMVFVGAAIGNQWAHEHPTATEQYIKAEADHAQSIFTSCAAASGTIVWQSWPAGCGTSSCQILVCKQ